MGEGGYSKHAAEGQKNTRSTFDRVDSCSRWGYLYTVIHMRIR